MSFRLASRLLRLAAGKREVMCAGHAPGLCKIVNDQQTRIHAHRGAVLSIVPPVTRRTSRDRRANIQTGIRVVF